jgi:plastocyanin
MKTARSVRAAIAAVAVAAILFGTALASSTASAPDGRVAATNITVGDNFFRPKSKTVRRGSSVSWVWRGRVAHNVTGSRRGRVAFRSKTTARRGYRYTRRFRRATSYRVVCTLHTGMRMTLRVR